jgi:hypothetical protein
MHGMMSIKKSTVTCLKRNLLPCSKYFPKSLGAYVCGKHLAGPGPELEAPGKHFLNVREFHVVTFVMSICSENEKSLATLKILGFDCKHLGNMKPSGLVDFTSTPA